MPQGRPTLDQDANRLIEMLRQEGRSCGNYRLKDRLGWSDDRYWRTHSIIIDAGVASRGRGRGGSIILIEDTLDKAESVEAAAVLDPAAATAAEAEAAGQELAAIYVKESQLYLPAKTVIESGWSRERSYDDFVVEITAQPGRVQTGGAWTRPDISLLGTKTYPFLPGRFFEIVTFEVKMADALDVRGVFEALSHSQFATLAYVLFHTPGRDFGDYPNSERVEELAAKHGVGVIAAGQIENYETWDEVIEPRRNIFEPEQANLFIGTSFSEAAQNRVVKWHK